jgi:hypothetical protein
MQFSISLVLPTVYLPLQCMNTKSFVRSLFPNLVTLLIWSKLSVEVSELAVPVT